MMIRKKSSKLVIDLDGPHGNAYVLMAYAKQYGKELGIDYEKVLDKMKESDYSNLVKTFDSYFGDYIDLETSNEDLL